MILGGMASGVTEVEGLLKRRFTVTHLHLDRHGERDMRAGIRRHLVNRLCCAGQQFERVAFQIGFHRQNHIFARFQQIAGGLKCV